LILIINRIFLATVKNLKDFLRFRLLKFRHQRHTKKFQGLSRAKSRELRNSFMHP